jgi:hypothetical protein
MGTVMEQGVAITAFTQTLVLDLGMQLLKSLTVRVCTDYVAM